MKDHKTEYKTPRIFVDQRLAQDSTLSLSDDIAHYLKNVLRRQHGAPLRVFNGQDGEFAATLHLDKKSATIVTGEILRPFTPRARDIHLLFAPIKKDAQDFMIEKCVELGVTHFHPVLTRQTVVRDLNEKRVMRQITEAAEQCERLDIPDLAPTQKLEEILRHWPEDIMLYAAVERLDAPHLIKQEIPAKAGIIIGPEGGFNEEERDLMSSHPAIRPVSLGTNILRAETAAIISAGFLSASS